MERKRNGTRTKNFDHLPRPEPFSAPRGGAGHNLKLREKDKP
jgi:hypothetical protein